MRDGTTSSPGFREHVYAHRWADGEPAAAVEHSWTESIGGYFASVGSGCLPIWMDGKPWNRLRFSIT
jgi:hypothetical protein